MMYFVGSLIMSLMIYVLFYGHMSSRIRMFRENSIYIRYIFTKNASDKPLFEFKNDLFVYENPLKYYMVYYTWYGFKNVVEIPIDSYHKLEKASEMTYIHYSVESEYSDLARANKYSRIKIIRNYFKRDDVYLMLIKSLDKQIQKIDS